MAAIELKNVCKRIETSDSSFDLKDISLSIPDGKTMVIIGPTGSGKSTLLRLIAGLIKADAGTICFDGENVNHLSPDQRHIGMVFQNFALYPHMTGKQNILSWFLFKKRTKYQTVVARERLQEISELLDVTIENLLDRKPRGLSGGEKQRVALARCVARNPKLFLMDEPFSSLDPKFRQQYRVNLKKILNNFKITTVYVTHDQQEANLMGDQVAVLNEGQVEQVGAYRAIYEDPVNRFVASFLNMDVDLPAVNIIDGELVADGLKGRAVGFRPEDATVSLTEKPGFLPGEVKFITKNPAKQRQIVEMALGEDRVFIPVGLDREVPSEKVWIAFSKSYKFDRATGKRIPD